MTKTRLIIICISLFGMLVGCRTNATPIRLEQINPPTTKSNFPKARYDNLLWHSTKGLLVTVIDSSYVIQDYYYLEGNPDPIPFFFPEDPLCQQHLYYLPIRLLPDERIGVIKSCGTTPISPDSNARYLEAYDLKNQELEQIVVDKLPHFAASHDFSWNPLMTRGVQELTDRLVSTVYWISPEGSSPIPLTLSNGKRSWSLEEQYYNMTTSNEGGSQFGYAGYPAWSPDGKIIAFWASFDAMGRKGIGRVDGEFLLVFLNPNSLSYEFLLRNIYSPDALEWSPNSNWLAFYGDVGSSRERGLWVFSPINKTLTRIGMGKYFNGSPVWSSDNRSLAVISCLEIECVHTEIIIYELQQLIP